MNKTEKDEWMHGALVRDADGQIVQQGGVSQRAGDGYADKHGETSKSGAATITSAAPSPDEPAD